MIKFEVELITKEAVNKILVIPCNIIFQIHLKKETLI